MEKFPKIGIIGAGVAGLSLACRLQRQKIPFAIYEARDAATVGHSYGVTVSWRVLRRTLKHRDTSREAIRHDLAVDGIIGGRGYAVVTGSKKGDVQVIDRSLREALLQRLVAEGGGVHWNHKFIGFDTSHSARGAQLRFEGQEFHFADLLVDAGGLRSPLWNTTVSPPFNPTVLPYVTYQGTRRISSKEFGDNFAHYFHDANIIELKNDTGSEDSPFISIQKIHLPNTHTEDNNHTVELRWVYSRAPRPGNDSLWRPGRSADEAKDVPPELFEEISRSIRRNFAGGTRKMLEAFFDRSKLQDDRILNWHLRIRLPPLEHFTANWERNGIRVVPIGDSAVGYPIVRSRGVTSAMKNGVDDFVQWFLAEYGSSIDVPNSTRTNPFEFVPKGDSSVYQHWYKTTVTHLQRLRTIHGQPQLTESELKDIIGFTCNVGTEAGTSSEGDSGAESSQDEELRVKGSL